MDIEAKQLRPTIDEHFSSWDRNDNGYLSSTELIDAIRKQKAMGSAAKVAEAALENLNAIQLLWNDEWGRENNGISRNDAAKFDDLCKQKSESSVVKAVAESLNCDEHTGEKFISVLDIYMPRMDLDQSGTLSKFELEHYTKTSADDSRALGVARFLADHFDYVNTIGSKNSSGAYNLLPGDTDRKSISANEIASLSTVIRSEAAFRERVWTVHREQVAQGSEMGKQGRIVSGRGEDTFLSLVGTGLEIMGHVKSTNTATPEALIADFEARKSMLESWKFFKTQK